MERELQKARRLGILPAMPRLLLRLVPAMALLGLCHALSGCARADTALRVVAVPMADLRAQPGSDPEPLTHDPLQETQLIYGEPVRWDKSAGGWAFVRALEQPEFTHNAVWEGYPGWVRESALLPVPTLPKPNAVVTARWAPVWAAPDDAAPSVALPMGSRITLLPTQREWQPVRLVTGEDGWISRGDLQTFQELARLSPTQRRQAVLTAAMELLGDAYFWGGRTPTLSGVVGTRATGLDCSALIQLAHRVAGVDTPRDAHEQSLRARPLTGRLRMGDLVFLSAPNNPKQIVHVLLYAGDDALIEAPGTGQLVRRIRATERLGLSLDELRPGDQINGQTVSFGTYLK